ncbi:MAG TPA: hypothetical protein VEC14_06350 [Reyranellaceae bacterium]|nr:hypothetical protein [Reyranellaceae bacterium]
MDPADLTPEIEQAAADLTDEQLEAIAGSAQAELDAPELVDISDEELEAMANAAAAADPESLSAAELAAAAGIDPLDDFDFYDAIESEKEAAGGYDPTDPGIVTKIWEGVKGMLGDLRAAGSEAIFLAEENPKAKATAALPVIGVPAALAMAAASDKRVPALITEAGGKLLGQFKALGEGALTAAKKDSLRTRGKIAGLLGDKATEQVMQREARRASWEFAREMRDVERITGNFNRTLETIFPEALKGYGDVPVDQSAARGVAVAMDPTNYVPGAQGAGVSFRVPLKGAVQAAEASLREASLSVARAQARRESAAAAVRLAPIDQRPLLRRAAMTATEDFRKAAGIRDNAQVAFNATMRIQERELDAIAARLPIAQRLAGGALEQAGNVSGLASRLAETIAGIPERVAGRVAANADEAARRSVADGMRTITSGLGIIPAAAGTAAAALRTAGRDLRVVGRLMQEAEGSLPFFRRVAKETDGLTSFAASLVDSSGLAPLVAATGRAAARSPAPAAFMGGIGYLASGGDAEQILPSAGVGAFLGMAGAGLSQWRRYSSPEVVRSRQNADIARYRQTLLPDQHTWFDRLGREDRTALAEYAHAHPDLQIRYSRLGKGADGFFYIGDAGGVAVVNLDSPRPLRSIVAHEVAHHAAAHGLDQRIQGVLLGDEATGKPGLYTLVDEKGAPVLDSAGRFQTTPEFRRLKEQYNAKVMVTADRSGEVLPARSDADIAREIFAEHGADWLLGQNRAGQSRLARAGEGFASDAIVRRLAQSELVNNTAFLKNLLAKSGAIFNQAGRVVGSRLFDGLGRSRELTELVNQYHRRAARLRQPESLSDGESGAISYDAAQIRKNPEILDKLFDGSGDVARGPDGKVLRNADGSPRFLAEKEQLEVRQAMAETIFAWHRAQESKRAAAKPGEESPAPALRLEERPKPGGGTEEVLVGTALPPDLLATLGKDPRFNPVQLRHLQELWAAVEASEGNTFTFFYQPAVKAGRNKRYRSLAGDWRTEAPYALEISKAGNIFFRTVSKEKLIANAQKMLESGKGPARELWPEGLPSLLRDVDTYLGNHAAGRSGAEAIGTAKRDALNELFGVRIKGADGRPGNLHVNPLFDKISRKEGDIVFRSRRLDRINRLTAVDETFDVDYDSVKANLRPAEAGDSAANTGGVGGWGQVRPGMEFDSVKRLIPKAPDLVPSFFVKGAPEAVYSRIRDWLAMNPVVKDADGRRIHLANPEGGGEDRLLNRARHLASSRPGGQRGYNDREFDVAKARLIAAVPTTLSDYHAKVERGGNDLYFRRYADGTLHMVVVDPRGRWTSHGVVDGSLLTQYQPESYTQFKGGRLVNVRQAKGPENATPAGE